MANPYAAPLTDDKLRPPVAPGATDGGVTPEILHAMSDTRPWVLFLSILGFISAGLIILLGLFAMVAGASMGAGPAGFLSVLYIAIGIVYIFLALYLYRYASSIKLLINGYGVHALEEALNHQKSFWKMTGIIAAIYLVLFAVAMLFGVVAGAGAMMFDL